MSDSGSPEGWVPALFTDTVDLIGENLMEIAGFASIGSLLIGIVSGFFGVRLTPYGTAFENLFTSDWFVSSIVFIIFMTQIKLYQKVTWTVDQLEPVEEEFEEEGDVDTQEENLQKMADGGRPPRDSKGRFKAKDSGGSNVLLIIMAGMTGYLIASQSSSFDPLAGALLGIAVIAFLQAS